MPKATLTYDLPEEQSGFNIAVNGSKYYCVLWDLDQWLRSEVKFKNKKELQKVRDKLTELMQDVGVDFEP
ncbi:MAG: hypothetical protein DDT22_00338 [candidate division WS2 bacterium]|nr:hypothetical protein [Candidatus Lithacetigena glycinireducens]